MARLAHGELVMSPGLATKFIREFARLGNRKHHEEAGAGLTDRELMVLQQVAQGATNKEISSSLNISENTVSYHMKNIFSKLHLRNRAEVVGWAFEHGFTSKSAS